jgi:hypothetical protein
MVIQSGSHSEGGLVSETTGDMQTAKSRGFQNASVGIQGTISREEATVIALH